MKDGGMRLDLANGQTDRDRIRQTKTNINRQKNRQTHRQTDRQTSEKKTQVLYKKEHPTGRQKRQKGKKMQQRKAIL